MQGEQKERRYQLCAPAAKEQDPDKLIALVHEINRLSQEKEQRLKSTRSNVSTDSQLAQ